MSYTNSDAIIAERQSRCYGALAQLVARYIRIVEVSGSNPLCSTTRNPLRNQGISYFSDKFLLSKAGIQHGPESQPLRQEESRSISDNVWWGQRKRFADGKGHTPPWLQDRLTGFHRQVHHRPGRVRRHPGRDEEQRRRRFRNQQSIHTNLDDAIHAIRSAASFRR